MAFTPDFLCFQRQQAFAQASAGCGSLSQVRFILAGFDQKSSCFPNASGKVGLITTVVSITLLHSSPSFEAITHCVRGVQYFFFFCLPSLFGPLLVAPATQLGDCRRWHPEVCSYYCQSFPCFRGRTGLSSGTH